MNKCLLRIKNGRSNMEKEKNDFLEDLIFKIKSGRPCISIKTTEEKDAIAMVIDAANKANRPLLTNSSGEPIIITPNPPMPLNKSCPELFDHSVTDLRGVILFIDYMTLPFE